MLPYFTLLFIQFGDEINCYHYIALIQCNLWSLYWSVLIVLLLLLLVDYTQGNIFIFSLMCMYVERKTLTWKYNL